MDNDNEKETDIFEKLEGHLPHSDIHYVNIATGLIATVIDVFIAFQERNTEDDCKKFVISMVAGLASLLIGLVKAPKDKVSDATMAYLLVLQELENEAEGEE